MICCLSSVYLLFVAVAVPVWVSLLVVRLVTAAMVVRCWYRRARVNTAVG